MKNVEEMTERELLMELVLEQRRTVALRKIKTAALLALAAVIIVLALIYVPRVVAYFQRVNAAIDRMNELSAQVEETLAQSREFFDTAGKDIQEMYAWAKDAGIENLKPVIEEFTASMQKATEFINSFLGGFMGRT